MNLNLKHLIEASYNKPKESCQKLGKATGVALRNLGFTRTYEQSLTSLLQEVHSQGGNFVYIKRASLDGMNLDGISYACNDR